MSELNAANDDVEQQTTETKSFQEWLDSLSRSGSENAVLRSVSEGCRTTQEVADNVEYSENQVRGCLKALTDDGLLARERDGRSYSYDIADGDETVEAEQDEDDDTVLASTVEMDSPQTGQQTSSDERARAAVNRDYDWDSYVPQNAGVYYSSNGEKERIDALTQTRKTTGALARILVGGPTGAGKTTLAEHIAAENNAPLFTIQGTYDMSAADLLGSPDITPDGSTRWVDGVLTKALLASQERTVVLLVDEINRAQPHAKGVLFPALDYRASVRLDGPRGGEVIEGNADNLIVLATMNEGSEYAATMKMDAAEKGRFSMQVELDYLGRSNADKEADLLAEKAGVSEDFAWDFVRACNEIRELADDSTSSLRGAMGVPTRAAIAACQLARGNDTADVNNPVMKAVVDAICFPLYDEDERNTVSNKFAERFDGAPVEGYKAWKRGDDPDESGDSNWLSCTDCDYEKSEAEAESTAVASLLCPECGSDLISQ